MRKVRIQHSGAIICLFLIGFIVGIIFVNLQWRIRRTDIAGVNLFFLGESGIQGKEQKGYLLYLLVNRLRLPVGLCLAGMLTIGVIAVYCAVLWYGFLGGMLLAVGLLSMGVKGMLMLLLAFLLPMLVYAPGLFFLLGNVLQMSESINMGRMFQAGLYGSYLLRCLMGLLALGAGILIECYVNPYVVTLLF
ncbi:MAG: stage II sporulation protein M [Lachnospiraceae bacterium]|nr:stage II sporulation protein M [Lachnospiraceae bacterium]